MFLDVMRFTFSILLVPVLLTLVSPAEATDFRTLNHTFVQEFPGTAAGDSSLRYPSGRGPFTYASSRRGFVFESGLISSPTTFSLDIPWGTAPVTSHPHPSFFMSPGVSLGYRFDSTAMALKCVYYGAFDFYFGSLESGPVLSRLQNPALFFERARLMPFAALHSLTWRLGMMHESNGMFVEDRSQFEKLQTALPAGYDAQDFASMGWNAWVFEAQGEIRTGSLKWRPQLSLRLYTHLDALWRLHGLEDTSLFYESGVKPHIWDYDGTLALLTMETPGDFFFLRLWPLRYFPWSRGYVTLGVQGGGMQTAYSNGVASMFRHLSYHIALKGRWYQLPWIGFLKYAYGYTQPIAYYSIRSHQLSMGIEFANFRFGQ